MTRYLRTSKLDLRVRCVHCQGAEAPPTISVPSTLMLSVALRTTGTSNPANCECTLSGITSLADPSPCCAVCYVSNVAAQRSCAYPYACGMPDVEATRGDPPQSTSPPHGCLAGWLGASLAHSSVGWLEGWL